MLRALIIFLFFLVIPVQAVEYHINESGHYTYSEVRTYYGSTHDRDTLMEEMWLSKIYLDFNSFPIIQKMWIYIRTYVGVHYPGWGEPQYFPGWNLYYYNGSEFIRITENSPSICMPIRIETTPPINASLCVYSNPSLTGAYTIYIDFNEDDYCGQSGCGVWTINYLGDYKLYVKPSDFYLGGKSDKWHGCFVGTCYGVGAQVCLPEWQGIKQHWTTGDISDYWWYEYTYYSENSTEIAWLNVTKEGYNSQWKNCFWKSINEGETVLHESDIESSSDQTGFNWSTSGYLINVSVYRTATDYHIINFTLPGGEEVEGTGDTLIKFYFIDSKNNALLDNVTFNVWGDYNFTGTVNKTKWIYVNKYDSLFYNASKYGYQWEGDIKGYTGYVYANEPKTVNVYFVDLDLDELEDSVNNTWLNFIVADEGNYIEGAAITVHDSSTWHKSTDENGFARFEVPKNDTYYYEIEYPGYYSEVGEIYVGSNPGYVYENLTAIEYYTTATPLPTDEAGLIDYVGNNDLMQQKINQFLNAAWNFGYVIFIFALIMTLLAILEYGGGRRRR